MNSCPEVHSHSEFLESFDSVNKRQANEIKKLKRFLKSDNGHFQGEILKGDLSKIKSFPRGRNPLKTLFVICKDCKKELINPNCSFCGYSNHSMNDAVLFFIGGHDEAYKKGKKVMQKYLSKG